MSVCVLDSGGPWDMASLGEIAFWSLEGGDSLPGPEGMDALGTFAVIVIHAMCWALSEKRCMISPGTSLPGCCLD